MTVARTTDNECWRTEILVRLAPHLKGLFWQKALSIVQGIESKLTQIRTMIQLAPYLSPSQQVEVVQDASLVALSIEEDVSVREKAMTEL